MHKKEYGCIDKAPNPVFEIDCVRCNGSNEECEVCKGSGKEAFYHCPVKIVTKKTVEVIKFYKHYKNGYLPVAGGINDQSITFLKAVDILDREINQLSAEK